MDDENENDDEEMFSGVEEAGDEQRETRGSLPTLQPIRTRWEPDVNRPRGILSRTDREYLWGRKEYKHAQTEANRRQEIRERVSNGLRDFQHLWFLMDHDERTRIFEELDEDVLYQSLTGLMAFVYLGLEQDKNRLEKIIDKGVYLGANLDESGRWAGEANNVDTSIEIQYNPDVGQIYDRLKQGKTTQLTPAEIGVLVREGKLDGSDLDTLEKSERLSPFDETAGRNGDDDEEK